jgi:hypothetical protein
VATPTSSVKVAEVRVTAAQVAAAVLLVVAEVEPAALRLREQLLVGVVVLTIMLVSVVVQVDIHKR